MAGSLNKAILIGRLGRDPELRHTQSNMAVCNFTLATNENRKSASGDGQEHTEWHRVVVWGRQAEVANQYLQKGRLVYVEGRIQTRKYTDRDGLERSSTEIVARDIQFLSSQGDRQDFMGSPQDSYSSQGTASHAPTTSSSAPSAPPADDFTEDDIPF
ncbi:MAG: single-stranded DNA-binding protein [Myxococcales bacterium]|nr:single-stranded DNA-binding protein [Myxococcales bacterium]